MSWTLPAQFAKVQDASIWARQERLVGLANPTEFLHQLGRYGLRSASRGLLLVLDLDRFRAIKNSLGLQGADELLCLIAARLRSAFPGKILIGHLGEDAFAMVFPHIDDEARARAAAQSVFELLRPPFTIGSKQITVGACIGIATVCADPDEWLRNANTALGRAKDLGPAQIVIYDLAMAGRDAHRLQLESELRSALELSETAMVYQPIVKLASGQVEGHEALMRWSSQNHGIVAPSEFIPMAERAGLAPMLDRWAFCQAIVRLQRFPKAGFVNVNVSACTLIEKSWIDEIVARFQASGLRAGQLRLEITETALLSQEANVHAHLIRLSRAGLPIILDDFGTGYSSLTHLSVFPIEGIKIDRSFVAQIVGDGREGRIVAAITRLGLDLNISITAEGVESEIQHLTLKATGCGYGQGHFYGSPRTASVECLGSH